MLFYSALLILILGCQEKQSLTFRENLESNPSVNVFLSDVDLILNFFEEQITDSNQIEVDKTTLYDNFRVQMANTLQKGVVLVPIDFEAQRNLYQKLSPYFFNNTWSFGIMSLPNDTISYQYLNLRPDSEIIRFIQKSGQPKGLVADYCQTLSEAGDISPSNVARMAMTLTREELKTPEVRLLMALHYLTLNDQAKRRIRL